MTHHILKATCQTVHLGGFSHQLKPVLTINSGDTIEVETYTGFYIYDKAPREFLTPEFLEICQYLPSEQKVSSGPHLLTGPIYIKDAVPGDVIEVNIEEIHPRLPIGFNAIYPEKGALHKHFSEHKLRFISLDLEKQIAEFPPNSGIQIPLKPFFGILGVATPENRSSVPPGNYGGNIDNKELQARSRIFLPVFVPGALFSIGDGHSAQGDGEVDLTAIETSMNGRIKIQLHKDIKLTTPIAETSTDIITMGFGQTLDAAFEMALQQMMNFLEHYVELSAEEAYVLCSLAVNFRITQVVNLPQKGVHGMLSKSMLPRAIAL